MKKTFLTSILTLGLAIGLVGCTKTTLKPMPDIGPGFRSQKSMEVVNGVTNTTAMAEIWSPELMQFWMSGGKSPSGTQPAAAAKPATPAGTNTVGTAATPAPAATASPYWHRRFTDW